MHREGWALLFNNYEIILIQKKVHEALRLVKVSQAPNVLYSNWKCRKHQIFSLSSSALSKSVQKHSFVLPYLFLEVIRSK